MIVVKVEVDTVHLMGWVGTPLSPAQWREAAAALFPGAGRVKWGACKMMVSIYQIALSLA